jgi:hypothetical protein
MTKGISMKTFFLGLIAASAMLVSGAVAQAGFISGGVSFSMETQNNTSGTVLDTRNIFDLSKNGGASGDFATAGGGGFVPNNTPWQSFTLTNPMTSPFTLSTLAFGTFIGNVVSDTTDSGIVDNAGTRTIVFSGSFQGGTLFDGSGKQDPTTANLTYTLQQSFTNPNKFFLSGITRTAFGTAAVPEPASMAIFGLGAIGFAARRFRRK